MNELTQLARLAEVAAEPGKDHPWVYYFHMVRGMAAYRTGDWLGTLEWCGRSRQVRFPPNEAPNSYFEAMAHHRLGHAEEARAAMSRATQILDETLRELEGNWGNDWGDWLNCQIVSQEADALLNGAAADLADGPPSHSLDD